MPSYLRNREKYLAYQKAYRERNKGKVYPSADPVYKREYKARRKRELGIFTKQYHYHPECKGMGDCVRNLAKNQRNCRVCNSPKKDHPRCFTCTSLVHYVAQCNWCVENYGNNKTEKTR